MKSIRIIGVAIILIGVVLGRGVLPAQLPSSWSQLMIIEYVDHLSSTGVGLEIYNPSGDTVDLGADSISILIFNHTDTCRTWCPTPDDNPLAGKIPPGGTFIVGNPSYCNSCTDSCDFEFSYGGLNGNDAVLLTRGDTAIDMIGIPCFCIGVNYTSYTVGGVTNGLFHRNISRCISNTTYYADSNGVYVVGDSTTSWPNNRTTNVEGWVVSTDQCITRGHTTVSCVPLPIVSLNAQGMVENCSSLITWSSEKVDSFQVMKLAGDGSEMVRSGVVYPLAGESEHALRVGPVGKDSYYQIISWLGGERVMESELVKAKRPEGNCLPEELVLFPVPASDDLFVHLPEPGALKVEVFDLQGQRVISHVPGIVVREHFLSVKGLSEGVYFYRIVYGNNQLQTGKLLIHRE